MARIVMAIVCAVVLSVDLSQCQPTHMSDVCDSSNFMSCIIDGADLGMGVDGKVQEMKSGILAEIVGAMVDLSRNSQSDSLIMVERKFGNLIDSAHRIRQNIRNLISISRAEEDKQGRTGENANSFELFSKSPQ